MPAAGQSGTASAAAEPSIAEPGDDLLLVFEIQPPDLAEVDVQERVTCTVTFPSDKTRQPCEATGALVAAHTNGSGTRRYAFAYQAPRETGVYDVDFEAEGTLRVPSQTYTAQTTFEVSENLTGQAGGQPSAPPDGDPDDPTDPTDGGPDDPAGDGSPRDGSGGSDVVAELGPNGELGRMAVSTTAAVAALLSLLSANLSTRGGTEP